MWSRPLGRRALCYASIALLAQGCASAYRPSTATDARLPRTASVDSTTSTGFLSPISLQIAGVMQMTEVRSALLQNTPLDRAVSLAGLDVVAAPRGRGVGVAARVMQSTGGTGDLAATELGVLVGGRRLLAEAAYVRRAGYSFESGYLHDSTHTFMRAGLRWRDVLGNSPFRLGFRAGFYLPPGEGAPEDRLEGWEGETTLAMQFKRVPLSAQLGYRLERFRVSGMEQEVSALMLGMVYTPGARP